MIMLALLLLWPAAAPARGAPLNAQLYPCSAQQPWADRQSWTLPSSSRTGGAPIALLVAGGSGGGLQLQMPSPSLATTCPRNLSAPCWNLVVGPLASALRFAIAPTDDSAKIVATGGAAASLCLSSSNGKGSVSYSNGFLANVFLTDCGLASSWKVNATDRTISEAESGQCLDVGSAGSRGDLGFQFELEPAAPPAEQAFHSKSYVSWGGSVIQAEPSEPGGAQYHMFAAVFGGGGGLSSWQSNSEIMHLLSPTPTGPFMPASDGPKQDGIIVGKEAHNPTVVRANDGTYLLFSIGHQPLLSSPSLHGPWKVVKFCSCNNPAPLVVPGRDEIYVYCHGGPDPQHWGASVGMAWTPHWSSDIWHTADNNTDDRHSGGKDLFGHPVEDPFAWYSPSTNPAAPGSFHLLCHGFRMGMVDNSNGAADRGIALAGNGYGAYANAPTPFGPWAFQEARVAYDSLIQLKNGSSLGPLQRRERPHLLLSKAGVPTHLYNGVCLPGGYAAGVNGSQHCYTHVQAITSVHVAG